MATQEEINAGRKNVGSLVDRIKAVEVAIGGSDYSATIAALQVDLATLNDVTLPGVQADLATLEGLFPITSTSISDSAITTPKLAANSVSAAKIVAGTITANEIAANSISADRLVANSIGAGQIAAGAITATQIAAGAITASKLDANAINGMSISGVSITAQTIAVSGTGGVNAGSGGLTTSGSLFVNGSTTLTGFANFGSGQFSGTLTVGTISGGPTISGAPTLSGGPTLNGSITCGSLTGSGGASYVNVGNSGVLSRGSVVSTVRIKENIADLDAETVVPALLSLTPKAFQYKDRDFWGDRFYPGVMAEEVADTGALELWLYRDDEDGSPVGVKYPDMTVGLLLVVQQQEARIAALEAAQEAA